MSGLRVVLWKLSKSWLWTLPFFHFVVMPVMPRYTKDHKYTQDSRSDAPLCEIALSFWRPSDIRWPTHETITHMFVNYVTTSNVAIVWVVYVVRCVSNNGHQKGVMCWKEVELHAHKYANHSRLHGQHDWGDMYDHLMSMRIFTLTMSKMFIWAQKIWGKWLWGPFGIC